MKRIIIGIAVLFLVLAFAQAQAAIVWEEDYQDFTYSVERNGTLYEPPYNFIDSIFCRDTKTSLPPASGSLSDTASASLTEFGGDFQMNAMAEGCVTPIGGMLVRGFAKVNLSDDFKDNYGVDVDQKAISWISRRFSVDSEGDYYLRAYLIGQVKFDSFGEGTTYHALIEALGGKVTLEGYKGELTNPEPIPEYNWSIELDDDTRNDNIPVTLYTQTGQGEKIFYKLKATLTLEIDIQNLEFFTIKGALNGPFQLGSAEEPFELAGFVSSEQNLDPTASFVADPTFGEAPLTVNFDASASDDPDGNIYSYEWNFGDDETGSRQTPTHVYTEASTYTVTLTVTDNDGATDTKTETDYITVTAPTQYTLMVDTVGQGSVALDPADGTYDEGTEVTLTATADEGWVFSEWSGHLSGSQNPATITMDSDKNVTATFTEVQPTEYTLTVTTVGQGSVTLDPADGTYDEGTEVTLTATADEGWVFSEWSGDLSGSDNPATITMDSDKNVTATFTEVLPTEYTLTVTTVGQGSVTLDPADGTYDKGTEVTLTATADEGWVFSEWSGALSGSQNPATITMDSDKNVTATFTEVLPTEYTLTVTTEGSGSVTLDPADGTYDEDTEVTLTATADEGWVFSEWSGHLSGSDNPATITMDSNKTVAAIFKKDVDNDGISDEEENRHPNGGDGNNDGILDSEHPNVTSLQTYDDK
ncbi:MAG: PKD domain-containing protein, partial [Desulfobacterales bacterium]|nr:PKD domain-containing protein [Desulfobacterales bacterium]